MAVWFRAVGVTVADVATDESPRAGEGRVAAARPLTCIPGRNRDVRPIVWLYFSPTPESKVSSGP